MCIRDSGKFSNNTIGSKLGDLKSNISLSAFHFKKSNNATSVGTINDTISVSLLYNFTLSELILFA